MPAARGALGDDLADDFGGGDVAAALDLLARFPCRGTGRNQRAPGSDRRSPARRCGPASDTRTAADARACRRHAAHAAVNPLAMGVARKSCEPVCWPLLFSPSALSKAGAATPRSWRRRPCRPSSSAARRSCECLFACTDRADAGCEYLRPPGRPGRVRAADRHVRLLFDRDLNSLGNRELNRMRIAQRQNDDLAFELRRDSRRRRCPVPS